MTRIPICPMPEVIFPGQLLPLQDPEPAVELAIQASVKTQRLIGIVYTPQHQPHALCRIGTLARTVGRVQSPTMETTPFAVLGKARFRILQLHHDHRYPEATVQLWPWVQNPPPVWSTVEVLGDYLKRYIDALSIVLPPTLMPEAMQTDTAALGILGAALLQIPADAKQALLEIPTTRDLVQQVLHYMQVYVPLTERLVKKVKVTQPIYEGISLN